MDYHQLALYAMIGAGALFVVLEIVYIILVLKQKSARKKSDSFSYAANSQSNMVTRLRMREEAVRLSGKVLKLGKMQRAIIFVQLFLCVVFTAASVYRTWF